MTGLTTGAITSMIERLEKGGFVRRERDTNNRRKVIIRLIMERTNNIRQLYESFAKEIDVLLKKYDDEQL